MTFVLLTYYILILDIDIVAINAGAALGGCVVGITEGALSEKKSVRDLAANFSSNKIGELFSENYIFV